MKRDSSQDAARECAAFPAALRIAGAAWLVALLVGLALTAGKLRGADWSASALALFALAACSVAWIGGWLLRSRTRLDGELLSQTWLWPKRAAASEVASLKLVHWPALDALVAPRMLLRMKGGALLWIHAADARLLHDFAARVVASQQAAARAARAARDDASPA